MPPSKYQQAVYDKVSQTEYDLIVDAVAGSGKTTTIVNALHLLPNSINAQFCAFNKHIAEELAVRVPSNVASGTLNSIGYRICRANISGKIKIDPYKTSAIYRAMVDERTWMVTRSGVERLVSLLKANSIFQPTIQDLDALIDEHDLKVKDKDIVLEVFEACVQEHTYMDFDDQIFYPMYFDLPIPQQDLVLVDESQDLNPIQIDLVMKLGKRHIAVGDPRQSIYAFRGADASAMDKLLKATHAHVLPLSVCYRCAKAIVNEAKRIVPHIEPFDGKEDGIVANLPMSKFHATVKDEDFVLCRCTAPLVSNCLKMLKLGRKATVRGRDIGQNLISHIESVGFANDLDKFIYELEAKSMHEISQLSKLGRDDKALIVQDRLDTIRALIEGVKSVADLIELIKKIFSDKASGVTFCTIHRSKGLEADRVFILNRELLPHPSAKTERQIHQEKNLEYVAITRAKKELYWMTK